MSPYVHWNCLSLMPWIHFVLVGWVPLTYMCCMWLTIHIWAAMCEKKKLEFVYAPGLAETYQFWSSHVSMLWPRRIAGADEAPSSWRARLQKVEGVSLGFTWEKWIQQCLPLKMHTIHIHNIYIYIWFVSWHLRLAGGIGSGGSTVKHACEIGEVLGSDAGQHKSFQTGRAKKCFGWKFSMSCSKEIFKAFLGSDKCSQFWFAYNVCFNITILRVLVTSVQA